MTLMEHIKKLAKSFAVRAAAVAVFSLWLGIAFHVHKAHTGDLHAHHSDCKVCSFSSGVPQKFLQASQAVFAFSEHFYAVLELPAQTLVSITDHLFQPSRAPPL